jgi:hypothetical protein
MAEYEDDFDDYEDNSPQDKKDKPQTKPLASKSDSTLVHS